MPKTSHNVRCATCWWAIPWHNTPTAHQEPCSMLRNTGSTCVQVAAYTLHTVPLGDPQEGCHGQLHGVTNHATKWTTTATRHLPLIKLHIHQHNFKLPTCFKTSLFLAAPLLCNNCGSIATSSWCAGVITAASLVFSCH